MESVPCREDRQHCNLPWRANSFFPILVFNELLRGPEPGSMALIPAGVDAPGYSLPASLGASLKQLAIEKLPSGEAFELAVRDGKTGFTFFNIEGHRYDYDANAQSLSITGGNLPHFKRSCQRARPASWTPVRWLGELSIGAAMQPVEVQTIVNGELRSIAMPPLRGAATPDAPTLVWGPDVIVGVIPGNGAIRDSMGTSWGWASEPPLVITAISPGKPRFVAANRSSSYPTEFLPDERRPN